MGTSSKSTGAPGAQHRADPLLVRLAVLLTKQFQRLRQHFVTRGIDAEVQRIDDLVLQVLRQLVEQEFYFKIDPSVAQAGRKGATKPPTP